MKKASLSALTFSLTDECNFHCSYCYQKNYSERQSLTRATLARGCEFFLPYLKSGAWILFYGGEPLLQWDKIVYTVGFFSKQSRARKKKFHFGLTTNGSLLDERRLAFLGEHRFSLTLSFDGTAQDLQRGVGSAEKSRALIGRILQDRRIALTTNSVFTPQSVDHLHSSMAMIVGMGIEEAILSLAFSEQWDETALQTLAGELEKHSAHMADHFKETGKIPVSNFRHGTSDARKVFGCAAGRDRLTLAPDGTLWGCFLFHDFFKERKGDEDYARYCFGTLDDFMRSAGGARDAILDNYTVLRQDFFHTDEAFCCDCHGLHDCHVCPITSGAGGSVLLSKVPSHVCRIQRIVAEAVKNFRRLSS